MLFRYKQVLSVLAVITAHFYAHAALPPGFVYLKDVDSTIQISMRYYSANNFTGQKVDGYNNPKLIITRQAAEGLKKVQQDLKKDGYCLVVYDAYRPQKAVDHFIRWGADLTEQKMKPYYYPCIDKKDSFDLGYIATKSGHTRGSTIDLTIIEEEKQLKEPSFQVRTINGNNIPFLDDGTVDMGSSFDLFDEASHHDSSKMTPKYNDLRRYLCKKMEAHGFKSYHNEWWHYTLHDEPFPSTYFDFDIE